MDSLQETVASFYIKQYGLLKFFALWEFPKYYESPLFEIMYNIYFWFLLLFMMLFFDWTMIMQIFTNLDNMDEIIKVFFILATAMAVLVKFLTIKLQNKSYEKLFQLMYEQKFLPENPKENKIFQKSVTLSRQVRIGYTSLSVSALMGILMTQYLSSNDEMPVEVYKPIELNTAWKYNVMYMYVSMSLSILCLVNVGFDSLATSLFIHLRGQLDILGYRLETIGKNLNSDSQDLILGQLKDCIRYYNRILSLSHTIEMLVSIPISMQITCSIFVLIANFYAMSLLTDTEDFGLLMKFALYQSCMLTQIFILCYFPNEVSLKSSELSLDLYKSNWYNWNKVNRKLVLLMMIRFEEPIRIKTINRCYSFNVPVFTSIVNSSYSYFALLKRINE